MTKSSLTPLASLFAMLVISSTTLAADAPDGGAIYHDFCSVCHGDKGDGKSRASGSLKPPPADFGSPETAAKLDRDRMIFSITYGRPNTAMAPWGSQLSRVEVEAVVDFIRNEFMPEPSTAAVGGDDHHGGGHGDHGHEHVTPIENIDEFMAEPFDRGLAGDPDWGGKFYDDNCATCHGTKGDGKGPRSYFILPKPRDFSHPAVRNSMNRPHLYEAIAKGTLGSEMSAWDKVLNEEQIANVAEYVFVTFVRPGAPAPVAASAGEGKGHHDHGGHDHGTHDHQQASAEPKPQPEPQVAPQAHDHSGHEHHDHKH